MVTEEDVLEGALAARLQGLPAPEPVADPRFTTWRPGSGAPPVLPPEPESPVELLGRPEDFAVVAPWAPGLVPTPLSPPSPWTVQPPAPEPPASADPLDDFFYREDEAGPALPEIAAAEPEPDASPVLEAREEFLTFLLGTDEYAVAIERVREVVRPPPIAEVPRAPPHILGVVTVRGEVVAVLDPRRRLGLVPAKAAEGEGKIVIVDAGEGPVGLQVDRVASVVRLRAGSIEACPQGIAGSRGEFLAGIGRDGERLFTVLDLAALLRRVPARAEPSGRSPDA
jgi:purine-binding chemotaxis protein CheW